MKHVFWASVSLLTLFLSFLAQGPCFAEDDIALTGKWEGTIQNDHQMVFRMVVEGDRMAGQWESLGSFGDWSLVKIKVGGEQNRKTFEIEDIVGVWKGPAAYKSNPGSKNVLTLGLEEKDGDLDG